MMRDTNQRLKSKGWAYGSICVLILLVAMVGCDAAGAGGSGGSESPGEALVLPEGNITDWTLGIREVGVTLMNAEADPVHGYGPVTVADNGDFPGMTIESPPPEVLLSWTDFQGVYCHELSVASITNDAVRFQSFCNVDVDDMNEILRRTDDGSAEVSWIYADGSTAITAAFDSGDYQVTIDLQLAAGWNRVVLQTDEVAKVVTLKTEAEPTGTGWYLN